MKHIFKTTKTVSAILLMVAIVQFAPNSTQAASLSAISDTMSNQTLSATSSHVLKFTTPTGISVNQTFIITFPSGFNFTSKTIGTLSMSYGATTGAENSLTLAASPSASNWGAVFSGTNNVILTLTAPSSSNTVPAANVVIVTYNSTNSVNPSSAANYNVTLGGGSSTAADSGSVTVPILTNSQVSVTATVTQSLSFSLGSNTVALGTLGTGAPSTGTHTMSLATNGISGAVVTVSGNTLTTGTSTTIAACSSGCTSSAGTAQFGLNLAANTSPSVGAAPSGSAPIGTVPSNYGTVNTFRFASADTVANSSGPINATTYTVSYLANISATTPAGAYSTSLTYAATANF